ncbi:DUF416 family protein [Actinokineospora enzanensis]|uniref:DUF416 family protein n=1 Tax=Actinokineospora enzanensis TaxID=155975 RepID=UPI000372E6E0|nr:DUF416 family protein [Actinokineospora enzanensis]
MNFDQRVTRALGLSERARLAFVAAVVEHALRAIWADLADRGDDALATAAAEQIWSVVDGRPVDGDALAASERDAIDAAPDTEDEPEAEDVTFALIALAHACRVARGVDVDDNVSAAVSSCEQAIGAHVAGSRQDDRSLDELANADPLEWQDYPEVRAEIHYQLAILDTLEQGTSIPDRASLLAL